MWFLIWLLATTQWVGLAYLVGRWHSEAKANRFHIDAKIRHERDAHGR